MEQPTPSKKAPKVTTKSTSAWSLGNLAGFIGNPFETLHGWARISKEMSHLPKEEGIFKVQLPENKNVLFINSPEYAKMVLSDPKNFPKGDIQTKFLSSYFGEALSCADFAQWEEMGPLIHATFDHANVSRFYETFQDGLEVLLERISKMENKDKVHIWDDIFRFTGDMMTQLTIAEDAGLLNRQPTAIGKAFLYLTDSANTRMRHASYFLPFLSYFKQGQFESNLKLLKDRIHEIVNASQGFQKGRSFVEFFSEISEDSVGKKQKIDQLLEIWMTGAPKLAELITWTLYEISLNTRLQEKIHNEIRQVCGKDPRKIPEFSQLKDLKILQSTLRETLRLYPAIPLLNRKNVNPVNFGEISVKAGTELIVSIVTMHRNPNFWENPEVFDPKRFSGNKEQDPFLFIPFGSESTPRHCPGKNMALDIAAMVTASIIKLYEISPKRSRADTNKGDGTVKSNSDVIIRMCSRDVILAESLPDPGNYSERAAAIAQRQVNYEFTCILNDKEVIDYCKTHGITLTLPPFIKWFSYHENKANLTFGELREIAKRGILERFNIPTGVIEFGMKEFFNTVKSPILKALHIRTNATDLEKFLEVRYGSNLSSIVPVKVPPRWMYDDKEFARQTVSGIHPTMIEKCTKFPINFPENPTENELKAKLKMEKLFENGKLFQLDYSILKDLPVTEGHYLEHPTVVFGLDQHDILMPLGIQFDKEVITPKDDVNRWFLAKLFAQNASQHCHQLATHFTFLHAVHETIAIATKRTLSSRHPLAKLMMSHLKKVIHINELARTLLLSKGAMIDTALSGGRLGAWVLGARAFDQWAFDSRIFRKDISKRKVSKEELPYYPYRDDSALWIEAIRRFVTSIVEIFYGETEEQRLATMEKDFELNSWSRECHEQLRQGKDGKDPGFPAKFRSSEDLIDTISTIVFGCTCQHSMMNFSTSFYYAFVPNAPGLVRKPFPDRKTEIDWDYITDTLPDIVGCLHQIGMSNQLSQPALGEDVMLAADLQAKYDFANPAAMRAVRRWKADLEDIERKIKEIDGRRIQEYGIGYEWLMPSKVAFVVSV
eukprot:TRINITY_DN3689_c0_g1_i3.p1 TRINITY_DN3689_c0_g1~~TRINITY_DN3689_c0_g1_i3.p1  ORF type:complete len:1059 (-),score=260.06 TRINITY_DN3689_c0_g1_i3:85-3261(-)